MNQQEVWFEGVETDTFVFFEGVESDVLVNKYLDQRTSIQQLGDSQGRIEQELMRRLDTAGATEYPHPTATVKIDLSWDYDPSRLAGLGELVPPDVLATGFTPAHEETVRVPDKWDMRRVLPWKKYGDQVAAVLDKARFLKGRRLVVKEKQP